MRVTVERLRRRNVAWKSVLKGATKLSTVLAWTLQPDFSNNRTKANFEGICGMCKIDTSTTAAVLVQH